MDAPRLLRAALQLPPRSRFSFPEKYCFTAMLLLFCAGPLWAVGPAKVEMMASSDVPAAQGQVVVKSAPNGNLQLDIKAAHLAEPTALTPAENVYVVWLEQPDENPLKLGEMRVDKNLSGEVRTITSFKHFRILITAEQNAEEPAPQAQPLLSADVTD